MAAMKAVIDQIPAPPTFMYPPIAERHANGLEALGPPPRCPAPPPRHRKKRIRKKLWKRYAPKLVAHQQALQLWDAMARDRLPRGYYAQDGVIYALNMRNDFARGMLRSPWLPEFP